MPSQQKSVIKDTPGYAVEFGDQTLFLFAWDSHTLKRLHFTILLKKSIIHIRQSLAVQKSKHL